MSKTWRIVFWHAAREGPEPNEEHTTGTKTATLRYARAMAKAHGWRFMWIDAGPGTDQFRT